MEKEKGYKICITLGRNETTCLKYLNSVIGFIGISYYNLFKHMKKKTTVQHEKTLDKMLLRLEEKKLIDKLEDEKKENLRLYISRKGILLLEVIKR